MVAVLQSVTEKSGICNEIIIELKLISIKENQQQVGLLKPHQQA